FAVFTVGTFALLYGSFRLLKPADLSELAGGTILINGQPIRLPVEPVLSLVALVVALLVSIATGAGMMSDWPVFALYWYAPTPAGAGAVVDPIFGRSLAFYLFTLPAWQMIAGWLMTLAVIVCGIAVFFAVVAGGTRALTRQGGTNPMLRGVSATFAIVLAA